MASARFTDQEIDLIITYLEELRDSQPHFFADVLNQEVTGRFFFEIRANKAHPAKAAFEGVDSPLDLAFKNTPALQAFKADMDKLMLMFLDERLADRYKQKIEGMIVRYSKDIMASDKWDAIFSGLSDKEKQRVENLITTAVVFKLLSAWGFNPDFIKGYEPKELMKANKLIREISAVSIGEVGKKEIEDKEKKAQSATSPQLQKPQDFPMTEQQKEKANLLEFQRKFNLRRTPEEKAKWADKFLDFLLAYHKQDFEAPKPKDENGLLLTALARDAFANITKLQNKHKELYTLYQARQEQEKAHKAKAEKFFWGSCRFGQGQLQSRKVLWRSN